MAPQNDLSNLDIDEVSPVRRGAIGKVWAFLKSNDDGDLELSKATVDAMGTPVEGEDALVADFEKDGLETDAIEANVVIARLKKAFQKKDAPSDEEETEASLEKAKADVYTETLDAGGRQKKISQDKPKSEDALEDAANGNVAKDAPSESVVNKDDGNNDQKERGMGDSPSVPVQKDDGTWDLSGVASDARPFYDAFLKSHDDAVAKADALAARVEKAEADNAELKDTLVVKELTAQVESEFSEVAKAEELTPILKAAKDSMDAETFGKLTELLKTANERIKHGDLFKEYGRSADSVIKDAITKGLHLVTGDGDAWDQIVEKANAMVVKDGEELSETQRIDAFLKTTDGKRLYADYMAERGAVA